MLEDIGVGYKGKWKGDVIEKRRKNTGKGEEEFINTLLGKYKV